MGKLDTVETFRARLKQVIDTSGLSRSAFADQVGTDRSTLSQLLSSTSTRLPRAETIAAIARSAQVSVDWLLGLSQEGQLGPDVLDESVAIEAGAASPTDERLRRWQAEAAGYKIRYVPTTLPDLLKSPDVIAYEFRRHDERVPTSRIEQAEAKLAYSRRPETDIEVCSARQSLAAFARGEGVWQDLPRRLRRAQLESMSMLVEELYPTFRWFLYDGRERYSVPYTLFGPLRAAVYVGDMYLVFNSTEHIRVLTTHFDELIRAAVVQPPEVAGLLKRSVSELG